MSERLLTELRAARARLNATIVAYRALVWAAPAAIGSGLLVAAARALGLGAPAYALWAALVAGGAAAGALKAWKSRMDEEGAARWLDIRLGDEELLSAALVCVGRGSGGLFDGEVVGRAESLLPRASTIKASPKPLAKRAGIAALACAIGAYLIFLAAPIAGQAPEAEARAPARGGSAEAAALAKATASASAAGNGEAASSFAASLFPDDKRLAKLAERALLEGRLDDLRDMLKAADSEYGSRIERSLSEAEKKKLTRERELIQKTSRTLAMAMGAQAPGELQRGQGQGRGAAPSIDGRNGGPGASGDGFAGKPGKSGGNQGSEGKGSAGDRPSANRDDSGGGAGGAGIGGADYGTGSGSEGAWGEIQPSSSGKEAVLEPSKKASFFELVLPGQASSTQISRLVPDSRKSAESAMAREGVPLEYEDFVARTSLRYRKEKPDEQRRDAHSRQRGRNGERRGGDCQDHRGPGRGDRPRPRGPPVRGARPLRGSPRPRQDAHRAHVGRHSHDEILARPVHAGSPCPRTSWAPR